MPGLSAADLSPEAMRIFAGVRVPIEAQSVARDLMARVESRFPNRYRWTRPESIHVTLTFVGEVLPEVVAAASQALADVQGQPMNLRTGKLIGLPRPTSPRILALELLGDIAPLSDLQARVAAALRPFVLAPDDRPVLAHATLARAKQERDASPLPPKLIEAPEGPPFEVTALELMRSHLEPEGARYETLFAVPLGGPVR